MSSGNSSIFNNSHLTFELDLLFNESFRVKIISFRVRIKKILIIFQSPSSPNFRFLPRKLIRTDALHLELNVLRCLDYCN